MSEFFDDDDDYGNGVEIEADDLEEFLNNKRDEKFAPIPYKKKETKKIIAIVDTETDPFELGLVPEPFALGFYDGERYVDFWGDDCVDQFFAYLDTLTKEGYEFIIFAHNGGKFDFHFFLKYLDHDQSPMIMGGRLVKLYFQGQEFRDSYSIIPQGLGSYKKDDIDYNKMKRAVRQKHKAEILSYQKGDCLYLYDLVSGFFDMFGDRLTVAGAALPMLNSLHGFERIKSEKLDERFRTYFYGGRNQCFETGIIRPRNGGKLKLFDRNSMYPAEMEKSLHPISVAAELQTSITKDTDFAYIEAYNDGALPSRREDGSLDFTVNYGKFHATIHEINAGLETGTLRIKRVIHAWAFERKATFADFVQRFYNLRLAAKLDKDLVRDILYKLLLNSGYGKFALNPRKFKQWTLTLGEVPEPQQSLEHPDGWTLHSHSGDVFIWVRPSPRKKGFYNVATAASITGAARANLLLNLSKSVRPIYCDTDSILCEDFNGDLDDSRLGGWKLEAEGTFVAVAGKKLYTLVDENCPEWISEQQALKKASKGARLTAAEIIRVCNGEEIVYQNPVPNFRFGKDPQFTDRRIRATG